MIFLNNDFLIFTRTFAFIIHLFYSNTVILSLMKTITVTVTETSLKRHTYTVIKTNIFFKITKIFLNLIQVFIEFSDHFLITIKSRFLFLKRLRLHSMTILLLTFNFFPSFLNVHGRSHD